MAGRRPRTDGTLRTDGSPEPAARSRTPLQRLRRLVSRLDRRAASGAHAYRMFDHNGTIFVHDPTDHTHTLPGRRTAASVHAILYTSDGTISRPLRLRDEAVPEFPRDTRIGARSNPRTVI